MAARIRNTRTQAQVWVEFISFTFPRLTCIIVLFGLTSSAKDGSVDFLGIFWLRFGPEIRWNWPI